MNTRILLMFLLLLASGMIYSQPAEKDTSLIVMTYNIRLNTPDDSLNAWPNRKEKVTNLIARQRPVVIGLQEPLYDQVTDIKSGLENFDYVGVARDDGELEGEFSPVFYDKSRLQPLKSGTFWLSQTPSVPGSRGWDAACNRVVTWARFLDVNTGKEFYVFNTHFDHVGSLARRQSTFLLMNAMDSIAGKMPVILTGDFNVEPNSDPVKILTFRNKPWLLVTDTRSLTSYRTGPQKTFMGFEVGKMEGKLIDFIFVKNIRQVSWHKILDENDGKYYPSDHLPVVVKLSF